MKNYTKMKTKAPESPALGLIWKSNTLEIQLAANATLFSCGKGTRNTTKIEGKKQLAAPFDLFVSSPQDQT